MSFATGCVVGFLAAIVCTPILGFVLMALLPEDEEDEDPLHPNGRCRCYGEGRCSWCNEPCIHGVRRVGVCDYCESDASCSDEHARTA